MIFQLTKYINETRYDCGTYETDAPEEVVEGIIKDFEADGHWFHPLSDAVVSILKIRGYTCEEFTINKFIFHQK